MWPNLEKGRFCWPVTAEQCSHQDLTAKGHIKQQQM